MATEAARRTPKEEACGRTVGRDVAARVRRIMRSMLSVARRWWVERAGEGEEEDGSISAPVKPGRGGWGCGGGAEGTLVFSCAIAMSTTGLHMRLFFTYYGRPIVDGGFISIILKDFFAKGTRR